MVIVLSFFFLFIYILCEAFKFRKLETIKKKIRSTKRLYDIPVCYVKIIAIFLSFAFFIIYYFSKNAVLERSAGIRGFLIILFFYLLFIGVSIFDIKRIKNGYNEELLRKDGEL